MVLHLVNVFGAGIVGEPVFAIHVFAVSFKHIERQTPQAHRPEIRHPLSVSLHHFQIFLIHPDNAVEERVLAVQNFGMDLKNVAVDFGEFRDLVRAALLTGCRFGMYPGSTDQGRDISNLYRVLFIAAIPIAAIVYGLILWSIIRYRKRRDAAQIMRVFGFELDVLQRRFRGGQCFFVKLAGAGANSQVSGIVFAGGFSVGAEFLDAHGAAIGVKRAFGLVQILLFREGADDLRGRKRGRKFGLRRADNSFDLMFRWRRLRAGGVFLRCGPGERQQRSDDSK